MVEMKQLENLFIEVIEAGDDAEDTFLTRSREGIFSPALTMWLMICKWIRGGRSLRSALTYLMEGDALAVSERNARSKRLKVENVSLNSGGLSRAQSRLKLEEVRAFTKRLARYLTKDVTPNQKWYGKQVFLMDGTTVALTHVPRVIERFKPTRNQNGETYTPNMQCLVCHELFSGIALNPYHAPYRGEKALCETALSYEMIAELPKDSLLIADRGFGIFPVAFQAHRHKVDVLLRLTETRARGIVGKQVLKQETCDITSNWKIGSTKVTQLNIPKDAIISGRFIKATIRRAGFRPLELFFFSTSHALAEDLVALYQQRERIENDIRSLKHTLGMERFFSKTPQMIEKELLLGVAAYNLLRGIIAKAAAELQLSPRDISFSLAADLTRIFGNKMRDASSNEERMRLRTQYLRALRQVKHPKRKRQRIEPRKIARSKQTYPPLRVSRDHERKETHKILEQHGHRGYFTSVTRKY